MFEQIGWTYDFYLNLAAVNAFFIAIKVVKYANVISKFKIYASTLGAGSERMMYFGIVIGLLLFGWSLFFLVLFGVYEEQLGDLESAASTCFQWILGDFDISKLLKAREFAAIIFFCFFQLMMFFVCINMFLATMLNTYSDTVGKMEVERETLIQKREREHGYIEVEYQDKAEMNKDLLCERDDHHDKLWVLKCTQGGKADLLNVSGGGQPRGHEHIGGDLLVRANGKSIASYITPETMKAASILDNVAKSAAATEEGVIRIVFKVSHHREPGNVLLKYVPFVKGTEKITRISVPYTVKTFWRRHSAVTWLNEDLWKLQRTPLAGPGPKDKSKDDGKDGEDDGGDATAKDDNDKSSHTEEKVVKNRVKKKLDACLFSRAALDKMAWSSLTPLTSQCSMKRRRRKTGNTKGTKNQKSRRTIWMWTCCGRR
jgi:hypothetical protein